MWMDTRVLTKEILCFIDPFQNEGHAARITFKMHSWIWHDFIDRLGKSRRYPKHRFSHA